MCVNKYVYVFDLMDPTPDMRGFFQDGNTFKFTIKPHLGSVRLVVVQCWIRSTNGGRLSRADVSVDVLTSGDLSIYG